MLVTSGTPTLYETFVSQSPQIIIGTPGRLASFLLSPRGLSVVRVSELDCLILDEADRLLSAPDHRRDVERIMRHLPKQRRTHLFSATMTDAVEDIIGIGLRNPVRIVVNLKDKRSGQEAQERRTPMGSALFPCPFCQADEYLVFKILSWCHDMLKRRFNSSGSSAENPHSTRLPNSLSTFRQSRPWTIFIVYVFGITLESLAYSFRF
jgi:ATP-dependent RNA helicase DDX55/SPB4